MSNNEIKRCPFCGSLPEIHKTTGGNQWNSSSLTNFQYVAYCPNNRNCPANEVVCYGSSRENVIAKWNTRYVEETVENDDEE